VECYYCHEEGHIKNKCPKQNNRLRECYKCGQTGHISRDCSAEVSGRPRFSNSDDQLTTNVWTSSKDIGGNPNKESVLHSESDDQPARGEATKRLREDAHEHDIKKRPKLDEADQCSTAVPYWCFFVEHGQNQVNQR